MTELLMQAIQSRDLEELVWVASVFHCETEKSYYKLLTMAAGDGSMDIVSYLFQNRQDYLPAFTKKEDDFWMAATMAVAIRSGQTEVLEFLLENGIPATLPVKFSYESVSGTSFLHIILRYAPLQEMENMLHLILRYGCAINYQDPDTGSTALHVAVKYMHDFAVKIILTAGANPSIRNRDGKTPLECLPVNSEIRFSYKERVQNIIQLLDNK